MGHPGSPISACCGCSCWRCPISFGRATSLRAILPGTKIASLSSWNGRARFALPAPLCCSPIPIPPAFTSWTCWLLASLLLMLLYLAWWIRYFRGSRRLADFSRQLCGLPLAGATLPVLAFLLLGIYGRLIWLVLGTLLLGVGHIGIHLRHAREIGAGPFSGSRQ